MSGIAERIVEDWLINADERGYQASFVISLIKRNHLIKYVSSHSTLEHGKDVISVSPDGELSAYQLKSGNISTAVWREIRGEVEELVVVPTPPFSGVDSRIPDRAYLVTSGRASNPVRLQIERINSIRRDGVPPIELIERDELLGEFLTLFETFVPPSVSDAAAVVGLAAADGRGRPRLEQLFGLFATIRGTSRSLTKVRRSSSDIVAIAEFASAPYRRAANHMSVIDVWVLAAVSLMKMAGQGPRASVEQPLELAKAAIQEASDHLWGEVTSSEDFTEDGMSDDLILPFRRMMVLSYAGARINSNALDGGDVKVDSATLARLFSDHIPIMPWGEGTWNLWINLVLAMRHSQLGVSIGELLVERWLDLVAPRVAVNALRDPYWTVEDAIKEFLDGRQPYRASEIQRLSYTLSSAIAYFARRGWRKPVEKLWISISRTDRAELLPRNLPDLLDWRSEKSVLRVQVPPIEDSWSRIRNEARGFRTALFDDAPWLLPFFMCVFPHRTNPAFSGELDARTASSNVLGY